MIKFYSDSTVYIHERKYMTQYIAGGSNDGPVEKSMILSEYSASELLDKDFSDDLFLLLF